MFAFVVCLNGFPWLFAHQLQIGLSWSNLALYQGRFERTVKRINQIDLRMHAIRHKPSLRQYYIWTRRIRHKTHYLLLIWILRHVRYISYHTHDRSVFFLWSGIYTVLGGAIKTIPRKLPLQYRYQQQVQYWFRNDIEFQKQMESVKWSTFNDNFFKFRSSHLYFWIFASIKRTPLHFSYLMHQTLKRIKWIH